jgi:hypothetical protein
VVPGALITLWDASPSPAALAGASGVSWGLLQPLTGMRLRVDAAQVAAMSRTVAWLDQPLSAGTSVRRGVLRLALDDAHATMWSRRVQAAAPVGTWLDAAACHALQPGLSGAVRGGVWVPDARVVAVRAWTEALRRASGARVHWGVRVEGLDEQASGVRLHGRDRAGNPVGLCADRVWVCAGLGAEALLGLAGDTGPLAPMQGEQWWVRLREAPRVVVGHRGHLLGGGGTRGLLSATYAPAPFEEGVTGAGRALWDRLHEAAPGLMAGARVEGAWAGVRPATRARDREVWAGEVPGWSAVRVLGGLGSRGLLWAPTLAYREAVVVFGGAAKKETP